MLMLGSDGAYVGGEDSPSILEPTEKDVLCGRGGMSNHHQGNEWYRRLIRSNRPLYRACPKHTKLLVAKAIVQAVEEQGGRFLERSRKTGMWYQVPYKRAVDKTSQGLRERDKDDLSAPQITTLPASLRANNGGKIPKPNLSALAQVTMAHAGMPIPSKPLSSPAAGGMSKMGQQQQRQRQQQPQPQQMQQQHQMQNSQMQQQQQRQQQMQSPSNRFSFTLSSNHGGHIGNSDPLDAPPQPGLLSTQSSMFRLFSRFGGGGGDNNSNNNIINSNTNRRSSDASVFGPLSNVPNMTSMGGPGMSMLFGGTGNMMNMNNNISGNNNMGMGGGMGMNAMNNNDNNNAMNMSVNMNNAMIAMNSGMNMNNMSMNQQQAFQQMHAQMQQQQQQQHQANQGASAPALTRLTTQMSDWLTSFWPVGKGGGNQGGNNAGGVSRENNNNVGNMGQGNNLEDFSRPAGNQGMSQASFGVGDNNSMIAMQRQQQQNSMMAPMGGRTTRASLIDDDDDLMPAPLPTGRMSGGNGLVPGGGDGRNNLRSSVASNIAPPAALESSISTTLLRLAASPSKILGSISTFFSGESTFLLDNQQPQLQNQQGRIQGLDQSFPDPTNDPLMDAIAPPPPSGGLGRPVGKRPSRRSSDLLDDYEETELEARMRAVAS